MFVSDLVAGTTARVSVAPNGSQIGANSFGRSISNDGRYVAFSTTASLVAGDTDGLTDVYVRDRQAGRTWLVSAAQDGSSAGVANNAMLSHDGVYVAFDSTGDFTGDEVGETGADSDVYTRIALLPEVSAAIPSTIEPGTTATIVLHGEGFRPDTQVLEIVPDVEIGSVTYVNEQRLELEVTADPGAAVGFKLIWIRIKGNGSASNEVASIECDDFASIRSVPSRAAVEAACSRIPKQRLRNRSFLAFGKACPVLQCQVSAVKSGQILVYIK